MSINKLRSIALATLLTAPLASADLSSYSQNFEALNAADPAALDADGWRVFGNVFDSAGNFLFGYGPFGAPNGGSGFSAIDAGQGGAPQGVQQLSIYNDYNCCQPSNGHFNGTDIVESNVFQEQIVGAADVGETYKFSFDVKPGNIGGATTALAFIKTLDPNAGFALTNFVTVDTTSLPATWQRFEIELAIDAGLVGQILQFGFASSASNFESSGVFYDNIVFVGPDSDGDGVGDSVDNCTNVPNANQRDTNGDGFGNACDADLNNDCIVNPVDLGIFRSVFFTPNADADFNGDGIVNPVDLGIFRSLFFLPPGPNSTGTCP